MQSRLGVASHSRNLDRDHKLRNPLFNKWNNWAEFQPSIHGFESIGIKFTELYLHSKFWEGLLWKIHCNTWDLLRGFSEKKLRGPST